MIHMKEHTHQENRPITYTHQITQAQFQAYKRSKQLRELLITIAILIGIATFCFLIQL